MVGMIRHPSSVLASSPTFLCLDLPPPPPLPSNTLTPQLDHFIAYALHCMQLHASVTFVALYLLQRLKAHFPAAKGSSGHQLFIPAFMLASKIICDDTYSLRYVLPNFWPLFTLMITTQLTEKFGLTKVKEMLKDIVDGCYDSVLEKQKADSYIVLECGLAMIPLAGLDVPFHSHYFWSGVMPFRGCE